MKDLRRAFTPVLHSYAEVIRTPSYFPLWLAQLISNFGDTLHYIALVVLVFRLSGQGLVVGGVVAAEVLPVLLLGPIAGVVIDRFNRKWVLIAADLSRALLALSLVWPQGVWHAYVVAAGLAAAGSFFNPTVQAVIPMLTNKRQRLAANSVAWSTGRLVQIVAAALAGGLIAIIGTGAAYAINAVSFIASAFLIFTLTIPSPPASAFSSVRSRLGSYVKDARSGLHETLSDPFLARLLLVQAVASLAVGATSALLVVLAERHLRLAPAGFAWLIGAIGIGALLGPLIPNILSADVLDRRWLFVPYVVRGIGDVLVAIVTPFPLALLILFVYGLNTSTGVIVFNSALQAHVPDEWRGRVFTLFDITWSGMRLVSLFLGGVLVDSVGVEPLYWVGGGLLVAAGVFGIVIVAPRPTNSTAVASS